MGDWMLLLRSETSLLGDGGGGVRGDKCTEIMLLKLRVQGKI